MEQPIFRAESIKSMEPCHASDAQANTNIPQYALEYVSDAVITTDFKYKVTGWNKVAETFFGHTGAYAVGRHIFELLELRMTGMFFAHSIPEIKEKGFIEHSHPYAPVGRAPRMLCTRVSLLRNNTGLAIGFISISRDVTAQAGHIERVDTGTARKEAALTDSDYLQLIDNTTEGSWIFELSTGLIRYSEQWARRMGLKDGNEINYREVVQQVVHPDDRASVHDAVVQTIQSKSSKYRTQSRVLTQDKGYIWVLNQGTVYYDSHSRPHKIIGIALDISETKQLELELARQAEVLSKTVAAYSASEKEYLMLADTNDIGFFVEDLVRGTLKFSQHWMKRFSIENRDPDTHFIEFERSNFPAYYWTYRDVVDSCIKRGENNFLLEMQIPIQNAVIFANIYGRIICDNAGEPAKVIGLVLDMTKHMQMEQQLRKKADELAGKNKLITNFFTNISHEFRTPLSIILMAGDLLKASMKAPAGADKELKFIDMLCLNSLRLQRLVSNLLDITKIDTGFMAVHRTRLDIVPMIGELIGLVADFAAPMGITVAFACSSDSFYMAMDGDMLQRILLNLLSNALKHCHWGGQVRVELKTAGDSIALSVEDDGDGIPQEMKGMLFDRFRQVNTSLTRESEGCGMGLALTKALVDLLGGSIALESTVGRGSLFHLELPASCDAALSAMPVVDGLTLRRKVEMELSDIQRAAHA